MRATFIAALLVACQVEQTSETTQAITGDFDSVDVNGADEAAKLAIRGNGDQLVLENSDGDSRLKVSSIDSASTWDLSPLPSSTMEDATVMLFHETDTTGALHFDLRNPNPGTQSGFTGVRLSPRGNSWIDSEMDGEWGTLLALGHMVPEAVLDVRDPSNHVNNDRTVIRADSNSYLDTTEGDRTGIAIDAKALNERDGGTNGVKNIALRLDAANGQLGNYAILVRRGEVSLGPHYISKGDAPTVSGCGTGYTVHGNSTSGFVYQGSGATGCTLTWSSSSPWSALQHLQPNSPDCFVQSSSDTGFRFTVASSTSALVIINLDSGHPGYVRYWCAGREAPED
jgi:hypothetical protein